VVEKAETRASAGVTLNDWRAAERALENATHARQAAEAAVKAAEIAERSARTTADAAKRALEAASEADATARRTAEAAMATSELAHIDLSAKQGRERDALAAEGEAKAAYHEAEGRARQNGNTG
jgi:hypothetical protein